MYIEKNNTQGQSQTFSDQGRKVMVLLFMLVRTINEFLEIYL